MAFRIEGKPVAQKDKAPVQESDYMDFIRSLPCTITGRRGNVQCAHLSTASILYGHLGRGKSQRSHSRWTLPLSAEMHDKQHSKNEIAFWQSYDINPYALALSLYGLWTEQKEHAKERAETILRMHRLSKT